MAVDTELWQAVSLNTKEITHFQKLLGATGHWSLVAGQLKCHYFCGKSIHVTANHIYLFILTRHKHY